MSFSLRLANNTEKEQRDKLAHAAWGDKLSVEQFAAREKALRAHRWSQRNLQTWLLLDEKENVLSSCETYRMTSFLSGASQASSYAIASVFTEAKLRNQGHASTLLRKLLVELRKHDSSMHSVTLYSEVGEKIYREAGFELRPSFERVLRPEQKTASHPLLQMLRQQEVLSLWPTIPLSRTPFVIWPEADQLDWHFERERIYRNLLGGKPLTHYGASLGSAFAVWCADYKADCLRVLFFRSKTSLEAQVLLTKISSVAHEAQLNEARIWENEDFTGWDRLGLYSAQKKREDSLAMIHCVASQLTATHWSSICRAIWV